MIESLKPFKLNPSKPSPVVPSSTIGMSPVTSVSSGGSFSIGPPQQVSTGASLSTDYPTLTVIRSTFNNASTANPAAPAESCPKFNVNHGHEMPSNKTAEQKENIISELLREQKAEGILKNLVGPLAASIIRGLVEINDLSSQIQDQMSHVKALEKTIEVSKPRRNVYLIV